MRKDISDANELLDKPHNTVFKSHNFFKTPQVKL